MPQIKEYQRDLTVETISEEEADLNEQLQRKETIKKRINAFLNLYQA